MNGQHKCLTVTYFQNSSFVYRSMFGRETEHLFMRFPINGKTSLIVIANE